MLYRILSYFRYYLKSTNLHGIHSPFVYAFVKNCVYDKKSYNEYDKIRSYRNSLTNDPTEISLEDHGAGNNSGKKKISAIAKRSASRDKKSRLLYRISRWAKLDHTLELGTNLGVGTLSLALGNPSSSVLTIEGDASLSKLAKDKLQKEVKNVEVLNDVFDHALPEVLKKVHPGLVYIDGNHRYDPTMKYFRLLAEKAGNDTILIFDDIYWSDEMTRAFEEMKNDPRVSVSVDLFDIGILFFREGQVKQDFIVRF